MRIGNVQIVDTFAEGFRMVFTRLIITAIDHHWGMIAANECCGYGTSVIGCDAECGIESLLDPPLTPDMRPGVSVMFFGFSPESLAKAALNRIAQTVLTCPSTAVFCGLDSEDRFPLGSSLRYFGDGFQFSKLVGENRFWRIPVMDGEFICCDSLGVSKGVAGGNFLIQSVDQASGLRAAKAAVDSIQQVPGVVTPFPGGVVRSGSKVGSKYDGLKASTADAWCPTLRERTPSLVDPAASCVYEIVIDGSSVEAVETAMKQGITAACQLEGVVSIAAGNYGGKLGKFLFHLHELMA